MSLFSLYFQNKTRPNINSLLDTCYSTITHTFILRLLLLLKICTDALVYIEYVRKKGISSFLDTNMTEQNKNKCGNLGFESERYVYFKKRKQTFILFLIMTEMLFYEHMDSFMFP